MDYAVARNNMVKQQLRTNAITCPKILTLFETMNREQFLPSSLAHFAYSDISLPLSKESSTMTPLEEATLLQALDLKGTETVLEIGTGFGCLTTLLSQLSKKVWSIDLHCVANLNQDNITLLKGDGIGGCPEHAPYDVIVFTGAISKLQKLHQLQVNPNGKIFAPIGTGVIKKGLLFKTDQYENWQEHFLFYTNLPFLLHEKKETSFVF